MLRLARHTYSTATRAFLHHAPQAQGASLRQLPSTHGLGTAWEACAGVTVPWGVSRLTTMRPRTFASVPVRRPRSDQRATGWALVLLPLVVAGYCGAVEYWSEQQKKALIALRQAQLDHEPVSLSKIFSMLYEGGSFGSRRDVGLQRVALRGTLDPSRSVYLRPVIPGQWSAEQGYGYLLLTPLDPADGGAPVLLHRGWVSEDWKVKEEELQKGGGAGERQVTAECLVQGASRPDHAGPRDGWLWADPSQVAARAGLVEGTLVLVQLGEGAPLRPPGQNDFQIVGWLAPPEDDEATLGAPPLRSCRAQTDLPLAMPKGGINDFVASPEFHSQVATGWAIAAVTYIVVLVGSGFVKDL